MAEKYIMINDILGEHTARMQNLRKYYPFFCLAETTFHQYKDGKYEKLDMGYITMASLRFFINENNFNEQEIRYEQYEAFLAELFVRDFELQLPPEEEKELIGYIFDKIKNDGKPFEFEFFDPDEKRRKVARVKLIESHIQNGMILYHITAEGIEFYLDTKEIKDESKISVQQVLLEKMITAKNFKGGIEVVRRINSEVRKLIYKKQEVIEILSYDVFEGAKASNEYMETVGRWFEEEQKLFDKNKRLIEAALGKAGIQENEQRDKGAFYKSLEEINRLETELKRTIHRHGELIRETMELQNIADQMIHRAKLRKLRSVFDFRGSLYRLQQQDTPDKMQSILMPLMAPNIGKTFPITTIDNMLTYKVDNADKGERIMKEEVQRDYEYEDEKEERRIAHNYGRMFYELLDQLIKKDTIELKEMNAILEIKYGEEIFYNGDYYSFLVHLSQKRQYQMSKVYAKQETFLENLIMQELTEEERERFENISFAMTYMSEEQIVLDEEEKFIISNIRFERTGYNG